MKYIWILVFLFSQSAWSSEGTDGKDFNPFDNHHFSDIACNNSETPEECKADFKTIKWNKITEFVGYRSLTDGSLRYPSEEEIQQTNNLLAEWCKKYSIHLSSTNPEECVSSINAALNIFKRAFQFNKQLSIKYKFMHSAQIHYFKHYCHSRGSLLSNLITSLNPNKWEACAERGMEAGEALPMQYTCTDETGRFITVVFSTLPKEEACAKYE